MAEKQRFLDVWIVESNTVYKEVPYAVVTDWIQQGRLLEDDKAKSAGTKDWQRLGDMADFFPFFPRPEPLRADDEAEALDHVGLDFGYKKPQEEEDDDVDMIPLIDVSLVLLVFFMLTATTVAVATAVPTPETEFGLMADDQNALRIDIRHNKDEPPTYMLGLGDQPPGPEVHSLRAILEQLRNRLEQERGQQTLVINADKNLEARVARQLLVALRDEPFRSRISVNYYGVSQKEP